ncbi:hypothetical protein ACFVSW_17145 [Neobacillus sp. NPDC058068]|uniref:hypothetical protein n=1 Tax=Neobacillus sp. NPDC058068 TaxID=3346325 RepID=UPI0036D8A609
MKKKIWFLALLVVVVLSAIAIYWFYFSKPDPFLTNKQLIEEINQLFPEADVKVIQDMISIDKRHWVVPFVAKGDKYGFSNWEWQQHNWEIASINTTEQPYIWKINSEDPSTFHFVWNIHPADQIGYLTFYLIRERGFHGSNGQVTYDPGVQMAKKVALHEKSYGVLQLPDDWAVFMNTFKKVESAKNPDKLIKTLFPDKRMYFGWTAYDQLGKETIPNGDNNQGFSSGGGDIDFVMYLNESKIESPKDGE